MLDFTGKVAFVTGAGSVGEGWGNGKATAVLLARRGAMVCGLDLDAGALQATTDILQQEGLAQNWLAIPCDMLDSAAVERAVAACLARFGRIDVLVNNVGGSAPGDPVSMPEEVWQQQLDLNLTSAFLGCKHVNTVIPGSMHTPLVEHRLVKQLGTVDAAALIAKRHAAVPMGFMGDAWDVAHAVAFLASDEARYITATQLVVDGGMTAARTA